MKSVYVQVIPVNQKLRLQTVFIFLLLALCETRQPNMVISDTHLWL